MALSKTDQKQLDRASAQGRGAVLLTMALIHRSGSARTQKEIELQIEAGNCWDEFTMRNGALLHNSEA